jgi:hypothetical protein
LEQKSYFYGDGDDMNCYDIEMIKVERNVYITLPFNAKEVFNRPKGSIYVKGTINDIPYRSKLISRGNGVQIILIDKKMQKLLGFCGTSMVVHITISEDVIVPMIEESQSFIKSSNLDVISAITTRRSIRNYTEQIINEEHINAILNAGFCAPSAKNKRPWHFIVIRNKEQLMELGKINTNVK